MLKRIPLSPFVFAIFPILALLAYNITEVSPRVALRPVVISLVATIILLSLIFLVSRNWNKAALTTTLVLVLFFSYGQVYELLQKYRLFGFNLAHHRILVIVYLFALVFHGKFFFGFPKVRVVRGKLQEIIGEMEFDSFGFLTR